MDKVFLLSDVDEFYDQLEKIFKGNQTDVQGRWVVSNPCFEIWLYYCYLDSPEISWMLENRTYYYSEQKNEGLG